MKKEDWAPYVGDTFTVALDSGSTLDLVLRDVTRLDRAEPRPFSLIFGGPSEVVLNQRMHSLDHLTLGTMIIFLVPIGPDPAGKGLLYEAVFN